MTGHGYGATNWLNISAFLAPDDGNSRARIDPKLQWAKQNLKEKVCGRYVKDNALFQAKDKVQCCCGRKPEDHSEEAQQAGETDSDKAKPWSVDSDTNEVECSSFGKIQFSGSTHYSQAKVARVSDKTSADVLYHLLTEVWGVEEPRLLVSVTGGAKSFKIDPKLQSIFATGLAKVAKTNGAWFITGGTNAGVMKLVGDAIQGVSNACIGVCTYGIITNADQIKTNPLGSMLYSVKCPLVTTGAFLDANHTHHIMVDDGTVGQYGKEQALRASLEKYVMEQSQQHSADQQTLVPTVLLVLEGGPGTLKTVYEAIIGDHTIPVVLIKGTGRAADVLAYAMQHVAHIPAESLYDAAERVVLNNKIMEEFAGPIKRDRAQTKPEGEMYLDEEIIFQVMECVKKKDYFTVFHMDGVRGVDEAILEALLCGQKNAEKLEAAALLQLTISWNRPDMARDQVFVDDARWTVRQLKDAMISALAVGSVPFVKLLLSYGVSMQEMIDETAIGLLYAYTRSESPVGALLFDDEDLVACPDEWMNLARFLNHSNEKRVLLPMNVVMKKLGCLLSKFNVSDARDLFQNIEVEGDSNLLMYPFRELFFWAVVSGMHEMARFLWDFEQECMAKAIVAAALNQAMSEYNPHGTVPDDSTRKELQQNAQEFCDLSLSVLDCYFVQDENLTKKLLTCELAQFHDHTCLSLAVESEHKAFVAHGSCQSLLNELWSGAMIHGNRHSYWYMIGLLIPPLVFTFDFHSKQHFQKMIRPLDDDEIEIYADNAGTDGNQGSGENGNIIESPVDDHESPSKFTKYQRMVKDDSECEDQKQLSWWRKFIEFHKAPVVRFNAYILAYMAFLCIFSYVAMLKKDGLDLCAAEIVLIVTVVSITIEEFRQVLVAGGKGLLKRRLHEWWSNNWNKLDAIAIILFYVGLGLRLVKETEHAGHVIYAIDVSLWIVRLLDVCFAHRVLGPYVVMIFRMFVDMVYFLFILLVFLLAYGVAVEAILHPQAPGRDMFINIIFHPYFNIYGELFINDATATETTFGTKIINSYAEPIAYVLLGIYLLLANVLLLNLLIAIFNNTFTEVQENAATIWKFRRFELITEYASRPILVPPFILLEHMYRSLRWILYRCGKQSKVKNYLLRLSYPVSVRAREKLVEFEVGCNARFLRSIESELGQTATERTKAIGERVEKVGTALEDFLGENKLSVNEMKEALREIQNRIDSAQSD